MTTLTYLVPGLMAYAEEHGRDCGVVAPTRNTAIRRVLLRIAGKSAKLLGLEGGRVVAEVRRLLDDEKAYGEMTKKRNIYGDGQASHRIAQGIRHFFRQGAPPERFRADETAK